jgi:hypothetical protein
MRVKLVLSSVFIVVSLTFGGATALATGAESQAPQPTVGSRVLKPGQTLKQGVASKNHHLAKARLKAHSAGKRMPLRPASLQAGQRLGKAKMHQVSHSKRPLRGIAPTAKPAQKYMSDATIPKNGEFAPQKEYLMSGSALDNPPTQKRDTTLDLDGEFVSVDDLR